MDFTPKDYLLLLSPIVTLLIAMVTVTYNIFDRRRHYTLEREKLLADIKATIMENSTFFDDKYRLYKDLGAKISHVTATAQNVRNALALTARIDTATWNTIREKFETQKQRNRLDRLSRIIRSTKAIVTPEVHRLLTRDYYPAVSRLLSRVEEILKSPAENVGEDSITELRNIAGEIIGRDDRLKSILHEDLVSTFMGFTSTDSGPPRRQRQISST